MASNQTTYYGLSQWQASDKVERLDFNADNQKIDAALHGLEASKATAAALTNLTNTVNTKAAQTDLAALGATVNGLAGTVNTKAAQNDLNSLAAVVTNNISQHNSDMAVLRGENCWVKLGEVDLSADSTQVSISLPNGHVGAYREFKIIGALACSCGYGVRATLNGLQTSIYYNGGSFAGSFAVSNAVTTQMSMALYLTPCGPTHCVLMRAEGVVQHNSNYYELSPWSTIPSLSIFDVSSIQIFPAYSGYYVAAGSSLAVYGLKR